MDLQPTATEPQEVTAQNMELLRWLIRHEIRGSQRYRRHFTLLLISVPTGAAVWPLLHEIFRLSDRFFQCGKHEWAILLRETDGEGALNLVRRCREYLGTLTDLRFALATYPNDCRDSDGLLEAARRRLKAHRAASGA